MHADVIVIGGGLSGLAAAVDLSARGYEVEVLEQRGKFGGRAYSYFDRKSGAIVDNGQHLLMGCFQNTKRFLKMIGSFDKLSVQNNLEVTFYHPEKGFVSFRCSRLPRPFHVIAGLLNLRTLSLRDRFRLLSVLREVAFRGEHSKSWDSKTVDEWLTELNQSEDCKKYFWNVVATATLNDNPKRASAALFARVLREAFLNGRESSVLMIPKVGLSDLYVEEAHRYIEAHGGKVSNYARVTRVIFSRGKAFGVELNTGRHVAGKAVISSVPLFDLRTILPKNFDSLSREWKSLDSIPTSAIVTINLWLDREVMDRDFVSLLDSPIQWVFNKGRIFSKGQWEGSYLSCVISGAGEMLSWEKERLVKLALDEVGKVYTEARTAKLLHSVVVKEKRATLSSSPAMQRYRLPARTSWENFFLAGDWTDTGLPATIESAVKSGFTAARLAHEYFVRT